MSRNSHFTLLFLFLFSVLFSGNILRQGQQIKQFYSHSVTEALRDNGFNIYKTYLPCTDIRNGKYPRPWAEEPPIYYIYAAELERLGLGPQWASLFVGFGISLMLALLLHRFGTGFPGPVPLLLAMSLGTPVFMRYYSQHMPDTCAVLFFLTAVYFLLAKIDGLFILFLMLSVTTKAFAFFPAGLLVGWHYFLSPLIKGERRFLPLLLRCVFAITCLIILIVPFATWVYLLNSISLPNPYDFGSLLNNRHSGGWGTLLKMQYWDRYFTFVGSKGVGWFLFIAFFCALPKLLSRIKTLDPLREVLLIWSLGMIPLWLFVRDASIIHDHYVLQYFLPMALLGAEKLLSIKRAPLRYSLAAISVVIGISNPVVWRIKAGNDFTAPKFCWAEEHSLKKFPLK